MILLREYIRILIEGEEVPKVIFMAGGPGSGKSTVIRRLGLGRSLEVINPDDHYEESLKKENIPMNRESILKKYAPIKKQYEEAVESGNLKLANKLETEYLELKKLLSKSMTLFNQARKLSKEKQQQKMNAEEGYLVDGTGGNYGEISKQVNKLKSLGYEVAMIYIDIPKETSVSRDSARGNIGGRSIGRKSVESSWDAVNKNKSAYENLFHDNLFYIDASEENFEKSINDISSKVNAFLG